MARIFAYGALAATALILQLTVLDVLPFPGATAPNLVLLVVVAIAISNGPLAGLVTGFAAGLALDLAPPASHAIGAYALVFCIVGYLCGRAAGEIDRSALLPLAAMGLGAAGGSALYTVVGVTFAEPGVTWAAARHVLPLSVVYDVLLSPFVLYVVLRLTRWARQAADDPAAALARAGSPATSRAALRGAGGKNLPREPRLRPGTGRPSGRIAAGAPAGLLSASGRLTDGWARSAGAIAGHGGRPSPLPRFRFGASKQPGPTAGTGLARPSPRLRFTGSRQAGLTAAVRPARPLPRLRFTGSRQAGLTAAVRPAKPLPRLRFTASRRATNAAGSKRGVFAGGSLAGGSRLGLRLGANRASLRSRARRVFGLRPHGRQQARPTFSGSRSSSGAAGPGAPRFGAPRFGRSHFGRSHFGRPQYGGPQYGGPRRRAGVPRFRPARSGRPRPSAPRSGWMRYGGSTGSTGFGRRGWLSGLRPRRGWSAIWRPGGRRMGGRRTGGRRTGGFR